MLLPLVGAKSTVFARGPKPKPGIMEPDITRFATLLACPLCRGELDLGDTSALRCPKCPELFPAIREIPRFAGIDGAYADSFGFQWNVYEVMDDAEDRAVFREKTSFAPEDLAGMTVLDAGVGSGRYARLAARHADLFVGLDLSLAVERARKALRGLGNSLILQGDILSPPLRPESFDLVYSIGVLHHTPDTERAFRSLARLVAPGGHLAVWVYRKNSFVQELLNSLVRSYTTRLDNRALMRFIDPLARLGWMPLVKHLSKLINFSTHPKAAVRFCDTFDWYSPTYQYHHTPDEVTGWFRAAGFEDIRLLRPEKARNSLYRKMFEKGLIIGSGVNVVARRAEP